MHTIMTSPKIDGHSMRTLSGVCIQCHMSMSPIKKVILMHILVDFGVRIWDRKHLSECTSFGHVGL